MTIAVEHVSGGGRLQVGVASCCAYCGAMQRPRAGTNQLNHDTMPPHLPTKRTFSVPSGAATAGQTLSFMCSSLSLAECQTVEHFADRLAVVAFILYRTRRSRGSLTALHG